MSRLFLFYCIFKFCLVFPNLGKNYHRQMVHALNSALFFLSLGYFLIQFLIYILFNSARGLMIIGYNKYNHPCDGTVQGVFLPFSQCLKQPSDPDQYRKWMDGYTSGQSNKFLYIEETVYIKGGRCFKVKKYFCGKSSKERLHSAMLCNSALAFRQQRSLYGRAKSSTWPPS